MALASPQPGAAYYIRAFKDAAGTQLDGDEKQFKVASGNGTAADPFTFTWYYWRLYLRVQLAQRWFVVEVDADGDGPGQRVASSLFGPVLVGELAPGS